MKTEQQSVRWNQVVARAWQDEAFKQRLLADPVPMLREYGLQVPSGIEVKIVEDGAQVYHLTLPRKPDMPNELSEEDLAKVAGGRRDDPCAGGEFRAR